jgi:hypothetical protein
MVGATLVRRGFGYCMPRFEKIEINCVGVYEKLLLFGCMVLLEGAK